jgi:hypothetical protein
MDRITHQLPRQQGYGSASSLRNDSLKHTWKHETRKKESKQGTKLSASGGLSGQARRTLRKGRTDSPARCRGQSARDTRTVRPGATDRPLKKTEPPESTREKRGETHSNLRNLTKNKGTKKQARKRPRNSQRRIFYTNQERFTRSSMPP